MDNLELLKGIYGRTIDPAQHLTSDFTLHTPGNSPLAGKFVGLEEFGQHLEAIQELSNGTFKLEPLTFMAADDWGLCISRLTAERNGKSLDTNGFGLWRFEDGKLAEHWEYNRHAAEWDRFWS